MDISGWFRGSQAILKSEKSSGFLPYLQFLVIAEAAGVTLYKFAPSGPIEWVAALIMSGPILAFIPIYWHKVNRDPDFARSESHVQTMMKLDREPMGAKGAIVDAATLDLAADATAIPQSQEDERELALAERMQLNATAPADPGGAE